MPTHPANALVRSQFNSLAFWDEGFLSILAHNWNYGAFLMTLEFRTLAGLFSGAFRCRVDPDVGKQSHDVHHLDGSTVVLDSGNSRIVRHPGEPIPLPRGAFLRGLHVTPRHFIVGGNIAEQDRATRADNPSVLYVVDRPSGNIVKVIHPGDFGDVCQLLVL